MIILSTVTTGCNKNSTAENALSQGNTKKIETSNDKILNVNEEFNIILNFKF